MADISKITLPSGNTYDIKDATARSMIAGGITFKIVWTATDYASSSAPSAAKKAEIPVDYTIYYNHGASFTKGTLVASETTKGTFYLIYSKTTAGSLDVYEEVVTVEDDRTTPHTFFWEKIGDTQIDLSNVVTYVTLNKVTDVVLGEATTFTNSSSNVTFSGGTTDKVLGEDTTFALTSGSVTHGTPTKKDALGASATFSATPASVITSVTPDSTYVKATASGTAVGANGTGSAITSITPTSDTFLKSASAVTSNLVTTSITPTNGTESVSLVSKGSHKLVTTSITPTNGTESVSKVTKTASKLVTTSITPVSGSTSITPVESRTSQTTANGTYTLTAVNPASSADTTDANSNDVYDPDECMLVWPNVQNETLILRAGSLTLGTQTTYSAGAPRASLAVPTAASAVTVATGSVSSSGTGSDIVTAVTVSDKTVAKAGSAVTVATGAVTTAGTGGDPLAGLTVSNKTVAKAGSAVTVATGSVDDEGTGDAVVTQVAIGTTASALTGLGTPSTDTFLKSVKVTTQPTITLTKSDTSSTGAIELVEDVDTTTSGITVSVATADTVSAVTAMPTSTVGTGITVGTNDKVTVIKTLGTGTAAAQTITVGTNDKVTALTSATDVTVTKGNA